MPDFYNNIAEMIVAGSIDEIEQATKEKLSQGEKPKDILDKGLLKGMEIVAKRFKVGDMYVPEVIHSAQTMHAAMACLKPYLMEADQDGSGVVMIGTVEGDIHNVGKDLVAMMFEGVGFNVINLGVNVKPQVFVEKTKEHNPGILAMSALLTTTMPKMGETIQALVDAGLRDKVKIIAGGAPLTEQFVAGIGGDGYAPNAILAVEKAKELLGKVKK
jgi:5-methyltetrahydrofolate--homocysteine methyltransferase